MNEEQLKQYEPFFGGYFVYNQTDKNDEFTAYRVRKDFPDGRVQYAILRCYSFVCAATNTGIPAYPSKLRRLINDADIMLRLNNCPSVLKFYAKSVVPTDDGYDFFLLIQDALPLSHITDFSAVSKIDAYKIASAVCEAVPFFRSLGVTHKKICPENIYVDDTGSYLLGDFGIGSTYIPDEDYMTPEEYRVSPDISTVDEYQTGMLFYKLLNKNRAPFLPAYPIEITDENRKNAFMRRMSGETVTTYDGALPYEEKIIRKACAFEIAGRYRNLSTMKGDIDSLINLLSPDETHGENDSGDPVSKIIEVQPASSDKYEEVDESELVNMMSLEKKTLGESGRLIKALIISISVIAVIAAVLIAFIVADKKKSEEPSVPDVTESTTTAPATTLPVTEPTTETSSIYTTYTQPSTSAVQTTEFTMQTTEFTLPEGFTVTTTKPSLTLPKTEYIDVDAESADITVFFNDEETKPEEIVIALGTSFNKILIPEASVTIFEYNSGSLLNTCNAEVSLNYEDEKNYSGLVCDIYLPDDFVMDMENCTYTVEFTKGTIVGFGYSNNEFSVDIDASVLE